MVQEKRRIIELSLELPGAGASLLTWLHARGITDVVEASCDFLDAESADETIAAHGDGRLSLPLVLYSYDEAWVAALKSELSSSFGPGLRMNERRIADELWQEAWEPAFQFLLTERFVILGEEDESPDTGARITLRLRSGTVFGSGQHATTQALIRLLEQENPEKGARFLDVGTGTGVLCLVASHLGYQTIWGTDIEADAIESARFNQTLNHIPFTLLLGSLPPPEEMFDTIVCNILPPTLTALLPSLVDRLCAEGRLYLAGMHEANEQAILDTLAALGWVSVAAYRERGWTARLFRAAVPALSV